jgi:nucleoside-diphosphate-sugar epimerase
MRRVLIAGCGYLGQAIADLFVGEGWEVEGWTMSAESAQKLSGKPYLLRSVDISQGQEVREHAGNFDAVVHCASTRGGNVDLYRRVYLEGARNLVGQFGGSRILFTSSTSVYAQTNSEWVTEKSVAEPNHETGKILCDAEQHLLGKGAVVVRLGGIYGPGRSALLRKFLNGDAILDPENDRFVNQIHRDDAADAIQFLLKRAPSAGEIYNVVDNEPIPQSECYRWLAAKLGRELPSVGRSTRLRQTSVRPGPTARQASQRKRGESNKRVSNAKLRGLGWIPRYPSFADGMEKSVLPNLASEGA